MGEEKFRRNNSVLGLIGITIVLLLLLTTNTGKAKVYPDTPKFYNSGEPAIYSVNLSNNHFFYLTMYNDASYADIIGVHTIAVKKLRQDEMMILAGKYKGKYYFNRLYEGTTVGVYTWKPGETSFKRVAKGIALDQFKKYHKLPWTGAKIGKYVTAEVGWPMDPSPRSRLYIFNLKTNRKRFVDKSVYSAKQIGKKIYYVKAIKSGYGFKRLDVKRCNANGKGKTLIKRINIINGSYVKYANLTKHYVKTSVNGKVKKYKYR